MLSFSRRHILATIAVLPIGGCGFEPVYGTGKAASALAGKLQIEEKNGRKEFEFRDRLQQRIGRAGGSSPYYLAYQITVEEKELVISSSVEIIRYNLIGDLTYSIRERGTGNFVFRDKVSSTTSYSATSETFPTRVAERAANVRLAHSLADQVFTRLSITAKDWLK